MAPNNVWHSVCICNYFRLVIFIMWPCVHRVVVDVVIAIMRSTTAVRGRLESGRCVYELTWLIDISFKLQGWSVYDLRVALPLCPDFCVRSICGFIDLYHLSHWLYDHSRFCCPLTCLLPAQVSLCFLCPSWYYLDFAIKLFLQSQTSGMESGWEDLETPTWLFCSDTI